MTNVMATATTASILINYLLLNGNGFYQLYYFLPSYALLGLGATILWARWKQAPPIKSPWLSKVLVGLTVLALLWSFGGSHVQKAVTLGVQWEARAYEPVRQAVRSVPQGCTISGNPAVWYAVHEEGRTYILNGFASNASQAVDVEQIDYLILPTSMSVEDFVGGEWEGKVHEVAAYGEPLPSILGFRLRSSDYQLTVYRVAMSECPNPDKASSV